MVQIIHSIAVEIDQDAIAAAVESITALNAAVNASQAIDQGLPNGFVLPDDVDDLVRRETVDGPASGTRKLNRIQIQPSDRHLELVAAIAAHRDTYIVRLAHGWPVLVAKGETVPSGAAESIA